MSLDDPTVALSLATLAGTSLLTGLVLLPRVLRHRRLLAIAQQIDGATVAWGNFGLVSHVRCVIDEIPVTFFGRFVRVEAPTIYEADLGRRDLLERDGKPSHLATALGDRPGVREAVCVLAPYVRRITGTSEGLILRLARGQGRHSLDAARALVAVLRASSVVQIRSRAGTRDCPYCKSDVTVLDRDGVVRCPSCDVLHHRECWNENAGCAVHGGGASGQTSSFAQQSRNPGLEGKR